MSTLRIPTEAARLRAVRLAEGLPIEEDVWSETLEQLKEWDVEVAPPPIEREG